MKKFTVQNLVKKLQTQNGDFLKSLNNADKKFFQMTADIC